MGKRGVIKVSFLVFIFLVAVISSFVIFSVGGEGSEESITARNEESSFVKAKDSYVIINSKEIRNIDDSDMLNKFTQLKGFKDIRFDISSSKDFDVGEIEKMSSVQDNKVKNVFRLNNLEVETEYEERDTSFFNVDERPIKQTYIIRNLLDEKSDVKLNIRYEIDSSIIRWNGIEYDITETPRYFEAFWEEVEFFGEAGEPSLTGHTLYFEQENGLSYYDFKDVVNLNYKVSVYSEAGKSYIGLEVEGEIRGKEEFVIDPEIGWTTRIITTSANGARSVFAIDIDNDNDIDVLSASREDDKIAWYENDGSTPPNWTARNISTSADRAWSVFAIDLDNDNDIDVLSASLGDNKIAWYESDLYPNVTIVSMIPIQVVENVDFVKDKTTLVRTTIENSGNNSEEITVGLYLNDSNLENMTKVVDGNSTENFDFTFIPTIIGTNIEIRVEMSSANSSSTDTRKKFVDFVETSTFRVDFVAVDERSSTFDNTVSDNVEFLDSTYPLANNDLITRVNGDIFDSDPIIGSTLEEDEKLPLLKDIYKKGRLSGSTDRVVGIAPIGWFEDHGSGATGFAAHWGSTVGGLGFLVSAKAILIEEGFRHGASHEIGHTFGLCDEYSQSAWSRLNILGCPNGDSDNNGELDQICIDHPTGCPTSTLAELVPWDDSSGEINLFNFMGGSNNDTLRWISEDSYSHLSDTFSSSLSFLAVDFGILVSGTVNKNTGTVDIDSYSYILDEQSILNESSDGNFSLIVEGIGGILYELIFQPQFLISNIGGNVTETNVSAFSFVIPFNDNVTKILVEENNITKDEVNRTDNTPTIEITSSLLGKNFSNELFNISWNATDADNDTLAYAILFSDDNGDNYQTLEVDYNDTTLELNSSQLPDCDLCRIDIVVSDGINTNSSVSGAFSIDNDLSINNFDVVYQNNTERVFRFDINNTFTNLTLSNISWSLETGEDIKYSQYNITLQSTEDIFVFVYHNYTTSGNYTVTAIASNEQFIERRSINITI